MAKIGTEKRPLVLRVQTEQQAYQIAAKCNEHGFKFVMGIEPDKSVDVSDLERALEPPRPAVSTKVGRNDPCPCGSGKKFKHCCAV
jgi:SWIM/SEC-C metal-binding protein